MYKNFIFLKNSNSHSQWFFKYAPFWPDQFYLPAFQTSAAVAVIARNKAAYATLATVATWIVYFNAFSTVSRSAPTLSMGRLNARFNRNRKLEVFFDWFKSFKYQNFKFQNFQIFFKNLLNVKKILKNNSKENSPPKQIDSSLICLTGKRAIHDSWNRRWTPSRACFAARRRRTRKSFCAGIWKVN